MNEIYRELGGSRFETMAKTKNLIYGDNFLSFELPRRKYNKIKITLYDEGSYDIDFRGKNKRLFKGCVSFYSILKTIVDNTGVKLGYYEED